jgi:hypothetical protein
MLTLYKKADNVLYYDKVRDSETDAYLNEGTATFTFKNAAGETVHSGTLAFVVASDGRYRVVIDKTVTTPDTIQVEDILTLEIVFSQDTYDDTWNIPVIIKWRR